MSTTEIARVDEHDVVVAGSGGALALHAGQTQWTPEQEAALVQIGLETASDADRLVFLHVAQRAGLDPFARQIYMIGRDDNGKTKWTIQTGIDGFRVIAERHPEYAGQTAPQWCGEDGTWREVWLAKGPPAAARVGVLRRDRDEPIYATCIFSEFAQTKKDGALTSMWRTKGAHMIAKCAEAGALRKAFPQDVAGLVTDDEAAGFERAQQRQRVTSQRGPSAPVTADELTSAAPATGSEPAAAQAPRARPSTQARKTALPGGTKRIDKQHQDRLLAAVRTVDWAGTAHGESKAWAGAVLSKDVPSWGRLTCDEAATLVAKLDAGDLSTGADAVIDTGPESAADAERDEVREAYDQMDAEAAEGEQGTLGGDIAGTDS